MATSRRSSRLICEGKRESGDGRVRMRTISEEVRRAMEELAGLRIWAGFWEDEFDSISEVGLSSQGAKTSGDEKVLTERGW